MPLRSVVPCLAVAAVALIPVPARQDVVIETIPVAANVYMLVGQGGNIGLSTGDDGAFLIDDQFAPLTDKILSAVGDVTDSPVRYLVNTHWHGDHTGGNENMGNAGVMLVAHDNVRERMSVEQVMEAFDRTIPASPEVALPKITFSDTVSFHWNGDKVHVFHVPGAHTDGDAILHFEEANVFHMGDCFFNGTYPFVDLSSGGALGGVIDAAERVLGLCDDESKIIPGHGPLASRQDLEAYRAMLVTVRDRVQALIDEGLTLDEVIARRPTEDLDETWGGGFISPEDCVRMAFASQAR